MLSGRRLDLLDPSPLDVEIDDIAHGLSRVARWKYVVGDLISPFKAAVGLDYKAFELRLMAAICLRFRLPAQPTVWLGKLVKRADLLAAHLEATELAGFSEAEANRYFGRLPRGLPPKGDLPLQPFPPGEAKAAFLARFEALSVV